jgi:hypothetical protein
VPEVAEFVPSEYLNLIFDLFNSCHLCSGNCSLSRPTCQ